MRVPSLTAWDARAGRRAALAALLVLALAWLVTAATDEGNVGWSERLARTLAVAPIAAAVGAWVALAAGRVRGELRALAALGRTPWQNARAAVCGGASVAALAAAAITWGPPKEAEAFYPEIARADAIAFVEGAFVDRGHGFRIESDGTLVRVEVASGAASEPRVPRYGRAAAAIATLAAGLALALLAANDTRRAFWLGVAAIALGTTLVLFQVAAVRLAPALSAAVPPLALFAVAAWRYRET
jgi:hypothetical protein